MESYPNSFHFTSHIDVMPKTVPAEKIKFSGSGLSFQSSSVKVGEKVYLNIQLNEAPKNITMASIDLTSSDNKRFTAFVKDIEEKLCDTSIDIQDGFLLPSQSHQEIK